MKAASNKSENKKRKRDDSQEPIAESPKKAKVHAQRKFAQGAAFNSPVITPVKDKVRPTVSASAPGPMLTSKCPNTEDFLTFLCFRRTSILPAKLDFFKDGFGSEPESSALTNKSNSSVNHKSNLEQTGKQSSKKNNKSEESKKSQTPAVQALRKKYQEQRLAKQKVTNVTKLAQKVKGKNMVRTRSSAVVEERESPKKAIPGKENKNNPSGLRSGLKRIQLMPKTTKKLVKPKHLRTGLRSGGAVRKTAEKGPSQQAKSTSTAPASVKKTEREVKKPKPEVPENKAKTGKGKKGEGFSDFSSDDNEPLLAVKKPKTGGGKESGKVDGGKSFVKTRSQANETETSTVSTRPTRKTKEAAAIYMEMITKKLVSPEKSGDDDVSSVDSFPELPNAKRNEQRETEIKAKALASKKIEPKSQVIEEKSKDTRKAASKKTTQPTPKNSKEESAKTKSVQKKESNAAGKSEENSVKRSNRNLTKDQPKSKAVEEKKEPQRPSTRSRHQEESESSQKAPAKVAKVAKASQNKEGEKSSHAGKKLKGNAKPAVKSKSEAGEVDVAEKKEEKKKTSGRKGTEKNESSETPKELKKRGRKPLQTKLTEREAETRKTKTRPEKKAKEEVEEIALNKRPTRKCSTADKIWIDIDGFTSDEDDFLDVSPFAKTRASAKRASVKTESETESNKSKDDKKKGKRSEGESGGKAKEEDSRENASKGTRRRKESPKPEESRGKQASDAKTKSEKKEVTTETQSQQQKPKEGEKSDKEAKEEDSQPRGKEERKEKRKRKADSSEEGAGGRRTRPVRQCSTGEKRWIETDSDSFSFYETSDDEDNLPIVDFSKAKSSPVETETKEEKAEDKDKGTEDNFSESDEEPLKKKPLVEVVPDAEKAPDAKAPVKIQREPPGLHPLKKMPGEPPNIPKPAKEPAHVPIVIPAPPEAKFYEAPDFRPKFEGPVPSVPNRIEMILHTLKRDKMAEGSSRSNDVKVTFGNVPYQPQPCGYQVKTMGFPPPREPISTHGLDLLSEVALPTTPKEKLTSQTERIEKWLKDSLAADQKKTYLPFEDVKFKTVPEKPETGFYFGKPSPGPVTVGPSSHPAFQKFGQVELLESQKLLKRNLFATETKQDASKAEPQTSTPKKALTSVQDLLKLQKERKEVTKASADNSPHLKNCKCNNCIVKKGWFRNKPVPKTEQQKSSPSDDLEECAKPFESLTKAFNKISEEGKNSKMSVSVAPMVVSPPSEMPTSSKDSPEKKGLFQRKLSFLERMKERERKEAAALKPSANAFSPSNESSVYAFEPEQEPQKTVGTNAPFRSKTRESRASSTSASRSDDEALKICEDESSTVSSGTHQSQVEKCAEKASKAFQSASIAVQVNLDTEVATEAEAVPPELPDGKSIEISTQTEVPEEDSDSPMFYIPLQQAGAAGASASSDQQLIRGVALKLGTEGPMGPNQRVIMKAKLVTKPPDSPSIKAVVMPQPKRIFDQKNNNPPIGTVQPTTRKPPEEPDPDKSTKTDNSSETDSESPGTKGSKSPAPTAKSSAKNKEKAGSKEKTEASDEHSPSSSKSKRPTKQKNSETVITPTNSAWLPPAGSTSKLVEAPTFHPTEKDFQDPFEFFERIRPAAEKFGLCRIVPPSNFKPDCKVSDDMRFTAYNQYVHRMFHRWGPNIKEMMAIKKYLATQSISLKQPPWIGGIEVDLPRLYQSVQNCGGLMKVMEKKKWNQVADAMKIPKAAQDRVTKLDDIYCKYLLPYDTLSHDERQKLFDEVEKDWLERQKTSPQSQDSQGDEEAEEENYIEECEECVVKGRNMALNQFYRIARNTMSMWFKSPEPSSREVEAEFWKHVSERNHHVCVHSGSIDSSGWGYGFPVAKNNSFSKHPWNLKVLTNNSGSVLRYLGPVMGVTVPTLHVGMVFTAFCWYRDPHGLPWIEYLHTGAPKIWYGISDDNSTVFQEALAKLLPRYIKNKTIWLPSDTAMIPPDLLVQHGVSLCHTVQEPGQFILVFPRAFTSSICTGYLVSESVYFAQASWLTTAEQVFKDIQESCEPSMFSLEKLLFSIATDSRSSVEVLRQVLPMVWHVRQKEIDGRKTLFNLGLKASERLPSREIGGKKKKGRWAQEEDGDYECEVCRTNLYVSLVTNSQEEGVYCLPHAIDLLTQKRHQLKSCKLMYTYTQEEMNEMVEKLEQRIENKSQKKLQSKTSTSAK